MKEIELLSRKDLEDIVRRTQEALYLEAISDPMDWRAQQIVWNPNKEWSCIELEHIAETLKRYNLQPTELTPQVR